MTFKLHQKLSFNLPSFVAAKISLFFSEHSRLTKRAVEGCHSVTTPIRDIVGGPISSCLILPTEEALFHNYHSLSLAVGLERESLKKMGPKDSSDAT